MNKTGEKSHRPRVGYQVVSYNIVRRRLPAVRRSDGRDGDLAGQEEHVTVDGSQTGMLGGSEWADAAATAMADCAC